MRLAAKQSDVVHSLSPDSMRTCVLSTEFKVSAVLVLATTASNMGEHVVHPKNIFCALLGGVRKQERGQAIQTWIWSAETSISTLSCGLSSTMKP